MTKFDERNIWSAHRHKTEKKIPLAFYFFPHTTNCLHNSPKTNSVTRYCRVRRQSAIVHNASPACNPEICCTSTFSS